MIQNDRIVITEEDFPVWVKPSVEILNIIKKNTEEMDSWVFGSKIGVKAGNIAIANNYPYRELFIFAFKQDCDDVACFEKSKPGKVIIVHNWEERGFENGPEFVTFKDWYNYALNSRNVDDSYTNVPGIDYNPDAEN